MVDSESVAVGGEVAAWVPDVVVVDEPCGESEQPERDADADAGDGPAAVAFERQLALAGPKHRLDPLTDRAERAVAARLVLAVGPQQAGAEAGDVLLELLAREALVGDDGIALQRDAFEHLGRDLALGRIGGRQPERDRHAVGRAQQIQPETPEETRVGAAVAGGGGARPPPAARGLRGRRCHSNANLRRPSYGPSFGINHLAGPGTRSAG